MATWEVATSQDGNTTMHTEVDSGGAASISFGVNNDSDDRINQDYDHLYLMGTFRSSASVGNVDLYLKINSDPTAGNYSYTTISSYGDSGTNVATSQQSTSSGSGILLGKTTADSESDDMFSVLTIWIPQYSISTGPKKAIMSQTANPSTSLTYNWGRHASAGVYHHSGSVHNMTITPASGSFMEHSTATLYGLNASSG